MCPRCRFLRLRFCACLVFSLTKGGGQQGGMAVGAVASVIRRMNNIMRWQWVKNARRDWKTPLPVVRRTLLAKDCRRELTS